MSGLIDFFVGLWTDFTEFMNDLGVNALDGVLSGLAAVLEAMPFPEFLAQHNIGAALGPVEPYIGYFLAQSGLNSALPLLASAVTFRVLRPFISLGLWR